MEESVLCGGVQLRLIDTAGIRDTEDTVERLGVERSRMAMESAELVLCVVDGAAGVTMEDEALLAQAARRPHWVLVLSKRDLSPAAYSGPLSPDAVISLSSVTGEGLEELEAAMARLFPLGSDAGTLLTDERQEDAVRRSAAAVRRAREALEAGFTPDAILTDAEEALEAIGELTGRTAKEEIVGRIFSRFCVGK